MKLLIVFVSALVLVAHGNDTPSDKEDSVYKVKSEVVAGYAAVAGQEAGGPQGAFAEEVPVVQAFGAEAEPRVASLQEPAAGNVPAPGSGVYIPVVARVCTNAACLNVCNRLGYRYGLCVSLDTCWCYN